MNERIRELAEQARKYATENFGTDFVLFYKLFEEKFAELLVRECAGICEEHHAWTARMVGNQIKDHFGVE